MDEATQILSPQPSAVTRASPADARAVDPTTLTQRQWFAVRVLVRQAAIKATKAEMQQQGLKRWRFAHKEIVAMAEDYAREHRAELVAGAKAIVEEWAAEDAQRRQRQCSERSRIANTPLRPQPDPIGEIGND